MNNSISLYLYSEIHTLQQITKEKYLDVYFISNLKWRTHCTNSAAKANSVLGQLRQASVAWDNKLFKTL